MVLFNAPSVRAGREYSYKLRKIFMSKKNNLSGHALTGINGKKKI